MALFDSGLFFSVLKLDNCVQRRDRHLDLVVPRRPESKNSQTGE